MAGGAAHDAGRSRVSVCRSVQAVSGFVIRQRPRVGSTLAPEPLSPALAYLLDAARDALLWPLQRPDGHIHIEAAVLDRLRAMRKLG